MGWTVFHCAARASDLSLIRRLVRLGYNINAMRSAGQTAVYEVATKLGKSWFSNGHLDHQLLVLRTLCEGGADLNFAARKASILRDLIPSRGRFYILTHMEALKLLLKYGASPRRALHSIGANRAYVPFIRVLLDGGADIEELWDNMTPLARAAWHQNPDVVQALIDAGANVNGAGRPPLFAVIKHPILRGAYGHNTAATLRILCNAGADTKKLNDQNHSILSYVLILSNLADTLPEVLEALCKAGCDVNFQTAEDGDTPLHLATRPKYCGFGKSAVSSVSAQCVEILISYGADLNSQNDKGQTPLHSAICHSNLDCTRVLVEHGSRMDIKDADGRTPLMLASTMKNSLEISQWLSK